VIETRLDTAGLSAELLPPFDVAKYVPFADFLLGHATLPPAAAEVAEIASQDERPVRKKTTQATMISPGSGFPAPMPGKRG
jgi:hypothetical protein